VNRDDLHMKPQQAAPLQKLQFYRILNNDVRLKVFALIYDSPGISFYDLGKQSKLTKIKIASHVDSSKRPAL
jgi:hypothetical protein